MTPVGAVVRGVIAAAVGTLAMDTLWFYRYKRGGGNSGFVDWEFSVGLNDWESAPVPAKLGKRLAEGFLQIQLGPEKAQITNNIMHWGYGLSWGAQYGILAGSAARPRWLWGLLLGPSVWGAGYAMLTPAKLYKPIWEYDAKTLWDDFSAHLVYGLTTAAAFKFLAAR